MAASKGESHLRSFSDVRRDPRSDAVHGGGLATECVASFDKRLDRLTLMWAIYEVENYTGSKLTHL